MKACSYCGRRNEDIAASCGECGTEFPGAKIEKPAPEEIDKPLAAPFTDVSGLDLGFEISAGFSRPDWSLIHEFVRKNVPRDDLADVWNHIVATWLAELATDLGGGCRVRRSDSFFCLSDLEAETTRKLLAYAERALGTVRANLGPAAWSGYHGKHVLLLFADLDDYFHYISHYHKEGKNLLSAGVFIRQGYAHIALPYTSAFSVQHTVAHELVHNLLCHLHIPLWLNEGLAVAIEKLVTRSPFYLDQDVADRHGNHWNETNIQGFWAGVTYNSPGDDAELSYSLGEILVNLLSEKGQAFSSFIQAADWRDAGQEAALNFLGQDLGESLNGFLGQGDWRPRRKAIADYWRKKPI